MDLAGPQRIDDGIDSRAVDQNQFESCTGERLTWQEREMVVEE
jgi:hypothetical protein